MNKFIRGGSALGLVFAASCGVAIAQQTASNSVGDVVVTAQKRLESVKDVPIAITVLSAESLKASGAKTLIQLQGNVPALTVQGDRGYGVASLTIRGTGGNAAPLQDEPVATYVDGVYRPPAYFSSQGLSDVASIEIVRGPQGTLQGRNATSGAILVRTADPKDVFGGYVRASVADPEEYRVQAAVTGPIANNLAGRLSLNYFDEKGWGTNHFNGDHVGGSVVSSARGILLWTPDDKARVRFSGEYLKLTGRQALARWATTTITPGAGQAVLVSTPQIPLPPAQMDDLLKNGNFNTNITSKNITETPVVGLEASYDFGPVELVSVTGAWRYVIKGRTDSDGLAIDRQGFNTARYSGENASQEIRLQSTGDTRFRWLVGAYGTTTYSTFQFGIYNLRLSVPSDRYSDFRARQSNIAAAAFGDSTYKFTDQFSVSAGLRYTEESKNIRQQDIVKLYPSDAPLTVNAPLDDKKTWSDLSYRAIANFKPNSDINTYISYSRGFKSGGYNAFSVGPTPAYNPETLVSTEVGVKANLFDHRGYVAAAAYNNSYENLQVSAGVATGGVLVTNAAEAEIKGFELEGSLNPTQHLTLSGNVAYIDGTYKSFLRAPNINSVLVDASGNKVINAPKWQYLVQGAYDFDVSSNVSGSAQLTWRWRDVIYYQPTNQDLAHLRSDQDGELGARLQFDVKPSDFSVAVYGTNIADERVVTGMGLAFGYPSVNFNKPRSFGIELEKKF